MSKKTILPLVIVLVLTLALSFGAWGEDIDNLESSKDEVTNKIDETEKDLNDVKAEKSTTQEALSDINSKIGVLQDDIAGLQNDLAVAQDNLAKQQEEYEEIKANLELSQENMRTRVRSIYMNGDISYWEVLFSSSSIQDFLSNIVFCEQIVEQDKNNINTVQENKRLAEEKLAELEETKAQIADLKSSKEAQEAQFAQESAEKAEIVSSLEEDEDYLEEQLAEMAAESANIEAAIQAYYAEQAAKAASASAEPAENGGDNGDSGSDNSNGDSGDSGGSNETVDSGAEGTGSMRWPVSVSGRISSNYGYRSRGMHTGIDIACPYGTPVLAADSGTVILVKRLTYSYGQYVIIDHGGSISTLYAHMSAIHVSVGQSVSKGQQVGSVGSTGNSTGNHLHFEVRINGKHVNPWGYVSQP